MLIIGPKRTIGRYGFSASDSDWNGQFAKQSQFGSGQFSTGAGTLNPFPVMPTAQAFRYWWAAQTWRVRANITVTPSTTPPGPYTASMDSGDVPYSVGYSNPAPPSLTDIQRTFCASDGDRMLTPRTQDRYLFGGQASVGGLDLYETLGAIGNSFSDGGPTPSDTSASIGVTFGIMGRRAFTFPSGGPTISWTTPLGLVFDDAVQQVFMSFSMTIFMRGTKGDLPPQWILASTPNFSGSTFAFNGTLDGMEFPLYWSAPSGQSISGSVSIDTAD